MRTSRTAFSVVLAARLLPRLAPAQPSETNSPLRVFAGALARVALVVEPAKDAPPRTFTTTLRIGKRVAVG